ncbi:ribosomal protein S5 domain 2-like protein [Teratosphaeria nubilosa]|uniref:Ribosomal RNA-processing protein 43 n=1 Tax=Teratosphaeria nubilosa TaxID=161662 RepID=A0A6G1LCP0_9PEZI|nr:ribosomal protein S5 domain 2-like protein [Teratosphaeria nubilosa]
MANGTSTASSLSFSRETFAKLTPGPFLHAHLKAPNDIRPNGRRPKEFRTPTVNTGSLTHSNGSAVVRVGDTAIVCGVRAEILFVSDIPHPPREDIHEDDVIEELGLLVPNLELSTGCSPAHLPGSAPGSQAQSLSYRIQSLLNTSNIISSSDLLIIHHASPTEDDISDEGPGTVVKAYWTLYIDILCIALDGNAFDTAWAAVMAALRNTTLPKAWWDSDREIILCSPLATDAHRLHLRSMPVPCTFAVFSTGSPLKKRDETETWIIADPDAFEEDLCKEALTTVISGGSIGNGDIMRIEKNGGTAIGRVLLAECARLARTKAAAWVATLNTA